MIKVFRDQGTEGGGGSASTKIEKTGWTAAVNDEIFKE